MPTYVYEILDDKGQGTGVCFELVQSIKEDALTHDPKTKKPVRLVPQLPTIMIEPSKPKTIGGLAEKNREKMKKQGDKRIKKKKEKTPWWREKKEKPLNTSKWTPKQKERYIWEGKKPS